MAARLFVSRTSVNNWERGHTHPAPRKVAAWAAITGVRVEWLNGSDTHVYDGPRRISRRTRRRRKRPPHHGGSPDRGNLIVVAA